MTINDNEDDLIAQQIKLDSGEVHALTIDDLELSVYTKKEDEVEEDCSCDSTFMLMTIDEGGRAIHSYLFWVPATTVIYLIIDNAGGHGMNEAIEEYRELLFRMYKVLLLHQVPNSPDTNLLDLGVWRAMQLLIEKLSFHRCHNPNVLDKTVQQACLQFPAVTVEKVYQRWLLALDLIMNGNGGNRLVETHHGKLTNDPTSVTNHNKADAQAAIRVTIERDNNDDDVDDNDENKRLTIDGDEDFMKFEGAVEM